MKPTAFDYVRATSLDHAVAVLAEHDGDAKVLAGGQSLVPLLAMRLAQPTVLVDLAGLDELSYLRADGAHLEIGAMTRARTVETADLVAGRVPLLPAALRHVGHVTIRNRGTIGGSAAHADPAAELPAVLRALDGELVATGPGGRRTIAAADFFRGFLDTALEPGEVLTAVRLPAQPAGVRVAVQEFARRHGDFAIVAVFAAVELDDSARIRSARIAVAGADQVPVRAAAAEELLAGRPPTPDLLVAAADAVAAATRPTDDIHAPADYRRRIAAVLTRRCLEQATAARAERSTAA
ncbi:xanthine dehydrogenase family protein subunit M [Pseudonocardia sp. C8]|uniref:FAD binding domain-containing protein n=1 Tax=Pseudonocardia sp. C8 TaxID=2762759 RepID=UPI001642A142|nr:xanthine dehydrogenase family protein subunit M [Pseudonocardia sp. C8]MBC3193363.1 xanthine dehydrogenase family protein subunit M [Pseudonocardia sp. C8]